MPFNSTLVWQQIVNGGNVSVGGAVVDSVGRVTVGSNYTYFINFGAAGSFTNPQGAYNSPVLFQYDANDVHQWHLPFLTTGATDIHDVAIDSVGNILIIGGFNGLGTAYAGVPAYSMVLTATDNINTTLTSAPHAFAHDIFIAKYTPNGRILWAKKIAATPDNQNANNVGTCIAVDSSDNVIFGAQVQLYPADSFHPLPGTIDLGGTSTPVSGTGGYTMLIAKLDGATGLGIWAQAFGNGSNVTGAVQPIPYAISFSPSGDILVAGTSVNGTSNWGLGYGVATYSTANSGTFLCKYADSDGHCIFANVYGGGDLVPTVGVSVDQASGNIYMTGCGSAAMNVGGPAFPVPGQDPYTHKNNPYLYLVQLDTTGHYIWQVTPAGQIGFGTKLSIDALGNLFVTGNASSYGWDWMLGTFPAIPGPFLWGVTISGSSPPIAQFIDYPNNLFQSGTGGGIAISIGVGYLAGCNNTLGLWKYTIPPGGVVPIPNPANFTPVYAPSANTTFQSKFGFIWNGTLPPGATNILLKYNFPTGTITPGPGETAPFLLLNYPEPSGYFGPNAYGFVYKVTGGDGPTWGPGYTTILNWSWAAAFADAGGNAVGPYTAWQNVTKSAAVNVTNNGTVASTPYANPKVTTTPTTRGNLQSVSLS